MHARSCYPSLAKVLISEYYLVLIPSANHPFCLPCAQLQDRQNPRLSITTRASPQATCRWLDPSIGLIRDEPLMPVACFSSKSINLLTAYHDAYSSLIWERSKERVDSSSGEKQASNGRWIGLRCHELLQSNPIRTAHALWTLGRVGLVPVKKKTISLREKHSPTCDFYGSPPLLTSLNPYMWDQCEG